MARCRRFKTPTTRKEMFEDIIARIERIEEALKIKTDFTNNPVKTFIDANTF